MRQFHLPFVFVLVIASASLADAAAYTGQVLYLVNRSSLSGASYGGGWTQQVAAGGQVAGSGLLPPGLGNSHAMLWTSPSNPTDINPGGIGFSELYGTNGTQQVGLGSGNSTGNNNHAFVWNGSAASAVDLNPSGFTTSVAEGTNGVQQVGSGTTAVGNVTHGLLWNGTAASGVDLNPTNISGYTQSDAIGTDGTQQVGIASGSATGNNNHAILWSGSASTAVDLNPNGFVSSYAFSVAGNQEVGDAQGSVSGAPEHAMLWTGTGAGAIDLNPLSSITTSVAYGTNGTEQVGWAVGGATAGYNNAYLWTGLAGSAVDLQNILPISGGYWASSTAYTVDANGNVFGLAVGTYAANYGTFAVEWSPVPEPTTASLVTLVAGSLLLRRRKPTSKSAAF